MKKLNAEAVINLYKRDKDFGFILDVEDLIKFLDGKVEDNEDEKAKFSSEERASILFQVLNHNNKTQKRLKKLHESSNQEEKKQTKEEEVRAVKYETKTDICDVTLLVNNICACKGDASLIRILLPEPSNPNYRKIISAILLELQKKEKEDTEFMIDPNNKEFISEALESIDIYYRTCEIIKEYDQEMQEELAKQGEKPEEKPVEEDNQRRIIFLSKESGNYYIDDDLKGIDTSGRLIELLWDVRTNSPKIKRFINPVLKSLLGKRDGNSRIYYMQLDKKTVVIAGVIINKDFQNSEPFERMLEQRYLAYEKDKETLRQSAMDPKYMQKQEQKLAEIIKKLNSVGGKKNSPNVKKRVINHG